MPSQGGLRDWITSNIDYQLFDHLFLFQAMEIVVTAPTPMIQSPVSEEESDDQPFGGHEAVEKFDDEEMEKEQVTPQPQQQEPEPVSDNPESDESSRNNNNDDGEVEVILKREHFVERRSSSSESDSDFSLGPRAAAIDKPIPAGM